MPSRRKTGGRTRHGSRKLILKVFGSASESRPLTTSTIFSRVATLAGTKIPEYSVRSALRTLVRRKVLRERRDGREKTYALASAPTSGRPVIEKAPAPSSEPSMPAEIAPEVEVGGPILPALPHKLAVGESLILSVGVDYVESVTNVHGKLVVERHARASTG